ncbi:PAS domain S-box-containing protein [Bosea sp. BE125]|uniref:hybrid sensor histidine kinase/response regulator n=1 Tax=Bosea sp. BE125 TaxID=2817909 RepID=UPI00285E9EE8|nr:PAS domain S-box protein [Bosea sp. BE125]MDR6871052.1 PAS domain S-box-containing protein [Bosea sp. BE125]
MLAPHDPYGFLENGGEIGALIAQFDWSRTPLGPIETWPQSLRTTTALALSSPLPVVMLWGPQGTLIYNDGYAAFAGKRHPALLGANVLEGWPEAAELNTRVLDTVLAGGTLSLREQRLTLNRHGVPEDCWLDLDYMPILGEDGRPAGVFAVVIEITERVRTEQRLKIAQEAGGVGVFEWYPESGLLDVSDEYRRIWGLPPDVQVTDDLLVSLLHPDDRALSGPQRLTEDNPLAYAEYRRFDPATGETRWIARQGEAVSTPESGQRRFVGVCFDITPRKAAEDALRASEARWRNLFEQMQEGFFIAEAVRDAAGTMVDFRFVEMNPAFEARTDVRMVDAIGRNVSEIIPNLPPELITTYAIVLETGKPARYEINVPAMKHRWFEARARRIGPDRFSVLFLDITGRKKAEAALRESEARFRTLSQSMPNHVWTATPDGQLDWFNERVYAFTGAAPGTLDGEAWMAVVHPEDAASAAAAWENARRDGITYETEFRLRRQDGTFRWHIARAVPAHDERGAITRWVGTNTDIDAQKTAEAALADLADTLEERVAARTAELAKAEEALRHSQKMEAIGNLTGGIAHDFNNLLQVISGNLQLLSREIAGDEKAEKRVDNAMAGVARGSKLAAQLLAFGRRQPLEPKVVNVGRLIRDMDDLLRRTLGDAIEIESIIAGGLWHTLVDPANVENAILNLAINSRDAMDGQGRLTIEAGNAFLDDAYSDAHRDVTAGQYVQISVTDTGSGMSREVMDQIFEPFFSTKPPGKGTGLGLSMVYGFVKQSGGHVKVYSEPGQGTTIKLYLPRSLQTEDMLVEKEAGPVTGGSETILVVEDDEAVRETVIALLGELGYRVLKAPDAQSALAVIESGVAIDLLFTDVVMPGPLKSPELARKAKARLPQLSVLFTSGYTENSIVHGGRLDEGVNLLSKPYGREALARKIRQVLVQDGKTPSYETARPQPKSAAQKAALQNAATPVPEPARRSNLTVLVCEDDAIIRMDTADMVQDLGHVAIEAENGLKALDIATGRDIDILLTDIGLPDISGSELAHRLRALKPELAIIFATGRDQVEGFEGAARTALLRKPYRLHTLEKILGSILD